jgi:hypothetical protein
MENSLITFFMLCIDLYFATIQDFGLRAKGRFEPVVNMKSAPGKKLRMLSMSAEWCVCIENSRLP